MYVSSPLIGPVIDRVGPRRPLLFASGLLWIGYGIVWQIFRTHPPRSHHEAPSTSSSIVDLLLALGMCLTGIGSSVALSSAAGGVARSFGPQVRATVMGFTLAGFGLSASFWTGLAHLFFSDDTAGLLLLLGLGTASVILLGACGCRPPKKAEGAPDLFEPIPDSSPEVLLQVTSSRISTQSLTEADDVRYAQRRTRKSDMSNGDSSKGVDIYGRELLISPDFWLIWVVMACCCGTGLMIINNMSALLHVFLGFSFSAPPFLFLLIT